ncbi:UBN2 domain-containing protein [Tanacetum coccineum]
MRQSSMLKPPKIVEHIVPDSIFNDFFERNDDNPYLTIKDGGNDHGEGVMSSTYGEINWDHLIEWDDFSVNKEDQDSGVCDQDKGEVPVMNDARITRAASVLRYKRKRKNRLSSGKIRYEVRKINADKRARFKAAEAYKVRVAEQITAQMEDITQSDVGQMWNTFARIIRDEAKESLGVAVGPDFRNGTGPSKSTGRHCKAVRTTRTHTAHRESCGQTILVDEAGNPLKKVEFLGDYDSEDEVASVDNDMARSMASEMVGFGTQSLVKQWRDSYGNDDYDEDPCDDDMYEG